MVSVRKIIRKQKMKIRQKNVEPTLMDIMKVLNGFQKETREKFEENSNFQKETTDFQKEIRGRFDSLSTRVSSLEAENKSKFDKLSAAIHDLRVNMGSVHERGFRQSLEDRFGKRYTRGFDANNLLGIARLVSTKQQYDYLNVDALDQIENAKKIAGTIQESMVNKLYSSVDTVLKFVADKMAKKTFEKYKKEIADAKRKDYVDYLCNSYETENKGKTDDQINADKRYAYNLVKETQRILENQKPEDYYFSSFGFAAFVNEFFEPASIDKIKENHGYQSNLELDCRGVAIETAKGFVYDFAEIKSNDNRNLENGGKKQIKLAAKILEKALKAIHGDGSTVEIIGRLYMNNRNNLNDENDGNIRIIVESSKTI